MQFIIFSFSVRGNSAVSSTAVEIPIFRLPAIDLSLGAAALEKPVLNLYRKRYILSHIPHANLYHPGAVLSIPANRLGRIPPILSQERGLTGRIMEAYDQFRPVQAGKIGPAYPGA